MKKDIQFVIGNKKLIAFERLKEALTNNPVLNIYRQGAEMELHIDASADGYGAICYRSLMKIISYIQSTT